MEKVLITPRSYGKYRTAVVDEIRNAGYEPILNPYGQILTKDQLKALLPDCAGVIVGVDPLDADVLSCAPNLRAISKYGVGTDNIDMEYCKAHGIPVTITRGANSNAVADYAFTLLCCCARRVTEIDRQCHARDCHKMMGLDIYGKSIGILGLGAIGRGVAQRAAGFSMQVKAYDVFWDAAYAEAHGIAYAEPQEIFSTCDFISLHLPLTDETRNLVDDAAFSLMKPSCILVNTARGGLIDERALIRALQDHRIAAAGIDVFQEEPPADPDLYKLDNLIMGSHCAASTVGASDTMSQMATDNLLQSLQAAR